MKNWFKSKVTALIFVLLISAGIKGWLITSDAVPFNSDEAIVALMARHILNGDAPIFFYGQAYMGSLDAYLVSVGFAILGEEVWVIRLVQTLLYLGIVATTFFLADYIFKSWKAGLAAGLLMAIPAVNTSLYTTASLGGYGEALLLGNLMLLVTLRIAKNLQEFSLSLLLVIKKDTRIKWLGWFFAWGLIAGLGLWVFGLTFVYSIPCFLLVLWWVDKPHLKGNQTFVSSWMAAACIGFLIGGAPWWGYAFTHGLNGLVSELSGNVVAVDHSGLLLRTASHLVNYFLLGLPALFGFRPPWEVRWLVLPLIPFVLMFWIVILYWITRKAFRLHIGVGIGLLGGVILTQLVFFIFTPFGNDPSGRYFIPLAAPLAIFAGGFIMSLPAHKRKFGWAALAGVILFQFVGNLDCVLRNPPGLTTQFNPETIVNHNYDDELAAFLSEKDETHGYTNYWLAYPLAFQTDERLIYVPGLPYHANLSYTSRDDRYAPYTQAVKTSPRTAYITTRHDLLDGKIRSGFTELGVTWEERTIGDYHIFYDLSRYVLPEEMGFGNDTP